MAEMTQRYEGTPGERLAQSEAFLRATLEAYAPNVMGEPSAVKPLTAKNAMPGDLACPGGVAN